MAGRIAFIGRRSGVVLPWTGRVGTCEIRLQEAKRHAAGSRRHGFPALPIRLRAAPCAMGHAMAAANACRNGKPRACGWIRFAAAWIKSGPRTGSFQERPSSPSGCLATFDVAVSRTLPGRFGRSPYFRHQRLQRRSLRPRGGTRRINSLYQCSVTVGAGYDRTCLWAPSLPIRYSVRATRCFS